MSFILFLIFDLKASITLKVALLTVSYIQRFSIDNVIYFLKKGDL